MQPRRHPRPARAVEHQPVGRGQQHLEEHEQVEQVRGEECAVKTHQLDLEQRVKTRTGAVPAGHGEQQGTDADDAGQHQHQRRQAIDHQHQAERHLPVARQVHADGAGHAGGLRPLQQRHGNAQPEQAGEQIDPGLERPVLLAEHQHDRGRQQRQQNGRDDQVGHRHHSLGSRPSTWSVPVRPREASSTTRNNAVMAKLMTIAVSTSACGSGSV
ncbi:hypothetical protein D3C78_1213770 [compost metagenome]